jgi:peptidoglycan hydrolase CwlO-like protein
MAFDFLGPVTINMTDENALRAILRDEIHKLEVKLMTEFADLRDQLNDVFADLAAKIQRLQDAVDNPSSETHLSAEDQALLDEIKASVAAARGTVGDENADGVPAVE